jgi:Secretion system C-terminal sorting domain
MKKILIAAVLFCMAISTSAQNITAAEFFVDTDPGVGNGTPVAVAPGTTVSFNAVVPTISLANGFHFVVIRTKDAAGNWGLMESRGFYISTSTTNVGNITGAEFFLDTDPGVGNGTPVSVSPGANVSFTIVVPTTSLSNGFHFLAIRTKDVDGNWGLYENRGFYISSSTANAADITAAEFFVDADPGAGNGTPIAVATGSNTPFTATIPTTALSPGFHFVAIRTRDVDGKWGLFENRGFYISTSTTNVGNIVAAEFFVDTDPGVGNGTAITVIPGATVSFVASIPVTALSPGFHFTAIRTKDADGRWGLMESRAFYISLQTTNVADMVGAEYFIDADPGVGSASPFTVPAGPAINQNFVLNVPVGTSAGSHFLAIRFRDAAGKWGLFEFDTITVAGVVLPLRFLSFEASKNQHSVSLKWKTENEVNTSYFDVERSINGVDFVKIGRVPSRNTPGINDYSLDDLHPVKGVNFYRLRQADLDGRSDYSKIVRVLFDMETNMLVFPNPALDKLRIELNRPVGKWISTIYDAQGKMTSQEMITATGNMIELNITALAKGSYSLVLNNGLEILNAKFVKQ